MFTHRVIRTFVILMERGDGCFSGAARLARRVVWAFEGTSGGSLGPWPAASRCFPVQVILNVYDLSPINEWGYPVGLGVFHSGLEVDGREYTYAGGAGIFSHDPRKGNGLGMDRTWRSVCAWSILRYPGCSRTSGPEKPSGSPALELFVEE